MRACMKMVQRWMILPLVCLLSVLQGCSSIFGYDNLGMFVHWYVDDYVELTSDQKERFDEHFDQLHEWHRNSELKAYQQTLKSIQHQLKQPDQTYEEILKQVRTHRQDVMMYWMTLIETAEPHLLVLLDELSESQRRQLENNVRDKMLESIDKRLSMSREEWEAHRIARVKKSLSPWLGSLSEAQENIVTSWAASLHNQDKMNREFRLRWLSRLTELQALELADRKSKLAELLMYPDRLRTQNHVLLLDVNRAATEEMLAKVFSLRNQQQTRVALREVNAWLQRIESAEG